jgi:uncharacterized protein
LTNIEGQLTPGGRRRALAEETSKRGQRLTVEGDGAVELSHTWIDERVVETQLRRPLRGRWGVACRCHLGVPMVIQNHPRFEDGQPFPTLFWLTCPVLVKRASTLEAEGFMAHVNARAQEDPQLRARMGRALLRYRRRRDAHAVVEDSGAPPGGGPGKVKCLHAHVAHELADPPNPVGGLTVGAAGWPDCRAPCVRSEP